MFDKNPSFKKESEDLNSKIEFGKTKYRDGDNTVKLNVLT